MREIHPFTEKNVKTGIIMYIEELTARNSL